MKSRNNTCYLDQAPLYFITKNIRNVQTTYNPDQLSGRRSNQSRFAMITWEVKLGNTVEVREKYLNYN